MPKYAQFNDDGLPIAFYDDAIHKIPRVCVALDDDQYLELINNQGVRKWQDGVVMQYAPPEPTAEELTAVKDRLVREAMTNEADPMFFKYQAGEGTKKQWLDKRAEIKARFAGV